MNGSSIPDNIKDNIFIHYFITRKRRIRHWINTC